MYLQLYMIQNGSVSFIVTDFQKKYKFQNTFLFRNTLLSSHCFRHNDRHKTLPGILFAHNENDALSGAASI